MSESTVGEAVSARDAAAKLAETMPEQTSSVTLSWQDPMIGAGKGLDLAGLDYLHLVRSGELPPPPIAVMMNFSIDEIEKGRAVFTGFPGEEHYNPIGVVHGGYAATILDSALGCAVQTTLERGLAYTSLGLEVKYLRPITRDTGQVRCEANVLYRGRRQATSEAKLTSVETGKLLGTGTTTCLLMPL